jgi:hypothetical protein
MANPSLPTGGQAVSAKMRLPDKNVRPYRVFEIAAFIPTPAYRQAGTRRGILQHFRKMA